MASSSSSSAPLEPIMTYEEALQIAAATIQGAGFIVSRSNDVARADGYVVLEGDTSNGGYEEGDGDEEMELPESEEPPYDADKLLLEICDEMAVAKSGRHLLELIAKVKGPHQDLLLRSFAEDLIAAGQQEEELPAYRFACEAPSPHVIETMFNKLGLHYERLKKVYRHVKGAIWYSFLHMTPLDMASIRRVPIRELFLNFERSTIQDPSKIPYLDVIEHQAIVLAHCGAEYPENYTGPLDQPIRDRNIVTTQINAIAELHITLCKYRYLLNNPPLLPVTADQAARVRDYLENEFTTKAPKETITAPFGIYMIDMLLPLGRWNGQDVRLSFVGDEDPAKMQGEPEYWRTSVFTRNVKWGMHNDFHILRKLGPAQREEYLMNDPLDLPVMEFYMLIHLFSYVLTIPVLEKSLIWGTKRQTFDHRAALAIAPVLIALNPRVFMVISKETASYRTLFTGDLWVAVTTWLRCMLDVRKKIGNVAANSIGNILLKAGVGELRPALVG